MNVLNLNFAFNCLDVDIDIILSLLTICALAAVDAFCELDVLLVSSLGSRICEQTRALIKDVKTI